MGQVRSRRREVQGDEDVPYTVRVRKKERVRLRPEALLEVPQLKAIRRGGPGAKYQFVMQEIEDLASIGLSQEQIAQALAVNRTTVEYRLSVDREFRAAYERGRSRLRQAIATGLTFKAVHEQNMVAQIYMSKVHMGWRDGDSPYQSRELDVAHVARQIRDQLQALDKDEGAPDE